MAHSVVIGADLLGRSQATKSRFRKILATILLAAPLTAARAQDLDTARRSIGRTTELSSADIGPIVKAVQQALDQKVIRLSTSLDTVADALMKSNGRPHLLLVLATANTTSGLSGATVVDGRSGSTQQRGTEQASTTTIIEYTGQGASTCSGVPVNTELVREYSNREGRDWTVVARPSGGTQEIGGPIFAMLSGELPWRSGPLGRVGDHAARAFTASFPAPTSQTQMAQILWIDLDTLLPLRWMIGLVGVPVTAPASTQTGVTFSALVDDVRVPPGVAAPNCLP